MKTIGLILGAALGVGAISPVQAADLFSWPTQGQSNFYPANTYWTGVYVGGHVGAGWANAALTNPLDGLTDNPLSSGVVGGGQIGLNYQMGSWLAGIEGDLTGTDLSSTTTDAAGFSHGSRTDWTATVAGRFGYVFNRILVYGKGGLAFANDRETLTDPFGNAGTTATSTRIGWTAGAGVEFSLDRNWSVRLEYDYLGFGNQNVNLPLPVFGTANAGVNLDIQTVTAGINYHF
jgi:outer membrane immunogenic protein